MPLEPINVVFFEKSSVDGYRKMPRVHYHNKHEFYFLEKGQTKFFVDTEIFILEPGDMIFVPANTLHRTENLERYVGVIENSTERWARLKSSL